MTEYVSICTNGHIISYDMEEGEVFCRECGSQIMTSCPSCGAMFPKKTYTIKYDGDGFPIYFDDPYTRPNFCPYCSEPYPWTAAALDSACMLLEEDSKLSPLEIKKLTDLLPDLIVETPRTTLACVRIKNVLVSCSQFVADGLKEFVIDFACELVRHKLGL